MDNNQYQEPVWIHIRWHGRDQIRRQILSQVWWQVCNKVQDQIWMPLTNEVYQCVRDNLEWD